MRFKQPQCLNTKKGERTVGVAMGRHVLTVESLKNIFVYKNV